MKKSENKNSILNSVGKNCDQFCGNVYVHIQLHPTGCAGKFVLSGS